MGGRDEHSLGQLALCAGQSDMGDRLSAPDSSQERGGRLEQLRPGLRVHDDLPGGPVAGPGRPAINGALSPQALCARWIRFLPAAGGADLGELCRVRHRGLQDGDTIETWFLGPCADRRRAARAAGAVWNRQPAAENAWCRRYDRGAGSAAHHTSPRRRTQHGGRARAGSTGARRAGERGQLGWRRRRQRLSSA